MRLKLDLSLLIYDSTEQTNDPSDAIKLKKSVEESELSEVTRLFPISIPDGTTDQTLTLPDATTDYLLLLTDRVISVKLNGSTTAITLRPKIAGKKTPVMLVRGDVTALSVSNASGTDANLDMVAVQL